MSTSRIALALALLPTLALVPACEVRELPYPGDAADTDTTDTTGQTDSDGTDTTGDTDSDGTDSDSEPSSPPERPEPAEPCPDVPNFGSMECTTEDGAAGTSFCVLVDGEQVWTECSADIPCYPGEVFDMGCLGYICAFDGDKLYAYSWSEPDCNTPLVLNFDDAPLRFDAVTAATFDISGVGECLATDWPTLPWLALDRDRDGIIDSGRELFGSGTRLRDGTRARDGFVALRELDSNFDGRIDPADPAFADLVLWSDHDGDRRGDLPELLPVTAAGLVAIHLDVDLRLECDDRGNCGRERSRFEFRTPAGDLRTGEVIDVYLACQ